MTLVVDAPALRRSNSPWADAARRFSKSRSAVLGLAIVAALLFVAVFADVLAPTPYDLPAPAEARQFPSARHPFGTDEIGRDLLSRVMVGTRISLLVALSVQLLVVAIGVTLGMLAGFLGGWVDMLIQRLVEAIAAIPWMLLTLVLISALGSGLVPTILAIGLTSWVDLCRLVRAQILSLREKEFIEAAHAIGIPEFQIALRHFLPSTVSPIITTVTLGIPAVIFAEAGLSFLGLGINDPLPSLGKMVGYSAPYLRSYWHMGLFPTLTIALAMLGFSLLGDGLRDALDPRSTE